jgi:hypothetical protein
MVELRIALTDRTWRVGAPVRVEIAPRSLKAVVTVPRDAVILRQGASYVMRVRPDNTAERVAVNIGAGYANHVEIDGTCAPEIASSFAAASSRARANREDSSCYNVN